MAQSPQNPDLEAQRAAMKKVSFLVGKWTGEARRLRAPGQWTDLVQSEEAQYKLDGLVLAIEGIGKTKVDGKPVLQAFAILSYDDESHIYRMRAFNDGRYGETEVTLLEDGQGLTWGFAAGQMKSHTVMRINEKGEWTETGEITVGSQPPFRFLELAVHRTK